MKTKIKGHWSRGVNAEEVRKKVVKTLRSDNWKGKHRDRNTLKKLWKGSEKWLLEAKKTKEYWEKRKKIASWMKGEGNPNWKGGVFSKVSNKVYSSVYKKRHKARKKGAIGNHTRIEWENLKKKYNFTCLICKKTEPEIKLTEDHIIPLSKGGNDWIKNIQPLCGSCNSRKNNR